MDIHHPEAGKNLEFGVEGHPESGVGILLEAGRQRGMEEEGGMQHPVVGMHSFHQGKELKQ